MRNQWLRLLLRRCQAPSQPYVSQVHRHRSFTSAILQPRAPHVTPNPFPLRHHFTSSPESAVDRPKPLSDEAVLLVEAFAKTGSSNDEIKLDLDSKKLSLTDDLIFSVVSHPDAGADVAERIYAWVLESQNEILSSRIWEWALECNETNRLIGRVFNWFCVGSDVKLSSKAFNLLLKIMSRSGLVKDTRICIGEMESLGHGVSKSAFIEICKNFWKYGFNSDLERLTYVYRNNNSSRMNKIVTRQAWGDDVERQLYNLFYGKFSRSLISSVLKNLEMRSEGHEMLWWTYVPIMQRFVNKKLIKEAVGLYEFAMIGRYTKRKPSPKDCIFLLKKIVVGEELDMDLFSKVLRVFKAGGNVLTDSHLDSVINSLTSVGKMSECNKILLAMEEHGYVPSRSIRSKIAFKLSKAGKTKVAREFMDHLTSRNISDNGTWMSLVKGYCEARNLEEASRSFREMVEREGASCGGQALDLLVGTYCRKNRPLDAYKFVAEMVNDKGSSPWNATYKTLTSKLLAKKYFKEAMDVMGMMKNQDYAPDLDSFVKYLSKNGSADDAIVFTQAMTSKRFPSTTVFLRLFDAYIKAGRESEGQDFLSKCPSFIRNHADVLDLFYSRKSRGAKIEALAV